MLPSIFFPILHCNAKCCGIKPRFSRNSVPTHRGDGATTGTVDTPKVTRWA